MADFDNDEAAFESIIKHALPNRMITNFILVAEVIDNETEELSIFMSDRMTPWLAMGMLKSAGEMVKEGQGRPDMDD